MSEAAKVDDNRPNPHKRAIKNAVRAYDVNADKCPGCGLIKTEYIADYNKKRSGTSGGGRAWTWHYQLCTHDVTAASDAVAALEYMKLEKKKKVSDNTARELRMLEKDEEDWAVYTAKKDAKRAAKDKEGDKEWKPSWDPKYDENRKYKKMPESFIALQEKRQRSQALKEFQKNRPHQPGTGYFLPTKMTFGDSGSFIVKGKRKIEEITTDEVEIISANIAEKPPAEKKTKSEPAVQGFSAWHAPPPEETPKSPDPAPALPPPLDGIPMPMELAEEKPQDKPEEKPVEKPVEKPSPPRPIMVGELGKALIVSMSRDEEHTKKELAFAEQKLVDIKKRQDILFKEYLVCKALYSHQVSVVENLRKELVSVRKVIEAAREQSV